YSVSVRIPVGKGTCRLSLPRGDERGSSRARDGRSQSTCGAAEATRTVRSDPSRSQTVPTSFNSARRHQLMRVLAAVAFAVIAPELSAQAPNREAALETRKWFLADLDTLQSKFLALANAIPAEKYSWRPAPGVRSIGEAFMHVASEYYVF